MSLVMKERHWNLNVPPMYAAEVEELRELQLLHDDLAQEQAHPSQCPSFPRQSAVGHCNGTPEVDLLSTSGLVIGSLLKTEDVCPTSE